MDDWLRQYALAERAKHWAPNEMPTMWSALVNWGPQAARKAYLGVGAPQSAAALPWALSYPVTYTAGQPMR